MGSEILILGRIIQTYGHDPFESARLSPGIPFYTFKPVISPEMKEEKYEELKERMRTKSRENHGLKLTRVESMAQS